MECPANISRRESYCVFCGTIRYKSERPGRSRTEHDRMSALLFVDNKGSSDAARIFHKPLLLEKRNLEAVVEFLTTSLPLGLSGFACPGSGRSAELAPFLAGTD